MRMILLDMSIITSSSPAGMTQRGRWRGGGASLSPRYSPEEKSSGKPWKQAGWRHTAQGWISLTRRKWKYWGEGRDGREGVIVGRVLKNSKLEGDLHGFWKEAVLNKREIRMDSL